MKNANRGPRLVPSGLRIVLRNDILNLDSNVEFSARCDTVPYLAEPNRSPSAHLNNGPSVDRLSFRHWKLFGLVKTLPSCANRHNPGRGLVLSLKSLDRKSTRLNSSHVETSY